MTEMRNEEVILCVCITHRLVELECVLITWIDENDLTPHKARLLRKEES